MVPNKFYPQIDVKKVIELIKNNHFLELIKDNLDFIDFLYDDDLPNHDLYHAIRVALFSLVLSSFYNLTSSAKKILIDASLLHDVGRVNDLYDLKHGQVGALIAENILEEQDFYDDYKLNVVKMLIEGHNQNIYDLSIYKKYNCYSQENVLLLKIIKDADLLDRFRLQNGLEVHLNNLTLNESYMLIAFAKYLNQHPEIIASLEEEPKNVL